MNKLNAEKNSLKKHLRCITIYKYSLFLMLILFIGIIGIMHIILPDKKFSESENRVLSQNPRFSISSLISGKYIKRFEEYISDQFPGRDFWIGVKSNIEIIMGKRENNGVLIGKDGYLFQKFDSPDKNDIDKKLEVIRSLALSLEDSNIYFTLVPTSIKILEDKLPTHAPVEDQKIYINQIKNNIGKEVNFIDVHDALYLKNKEYIYYKTDHHWTLRGAYYAYQVLAQQMNFAPLKLENFNVQTVTDSFYGTLYSKSGFRHINPDTIEICTPKAGMEYIRVEYIDEGKITNSLYNMDNLQKKDKYTVFLDGNHPAVKITTNANSHKNLLLIKDSYAHSIVPFLACHYDEIYMIDPRYYTENIKNLIPDDSNTDILILYNLVTFFEDKSLVKMIISSSEK